LEQAEKLNTKGQTMSDQPANHDDASVSPTIERVHELSWALFDEQITDEQMAELEARLLSDATARDAYIRCVQLHTDLSAHFAKPEQSVAGSATKTPILGFLGGDSPFGGIPQSEDAKS
jgi:hypothetical protein